MVHKVGARLDGVASIEDVKARCYIDPDSGCWHLRTARGKPLRKGQRHVLWAHGLGHVTVTRLVWQLTHPAKAIPNGWRAYRRCDNYDCANPEHIKIGSPKMIGTFWSETGRATTPAKTRAAQINAAKLPQRKLTPELKQWIVESTQSGPAVAHAIGIGHSQVSAVRRQHRAKLCVLPVATVFDLAMRAAA